MQPIPLLLMAHITMLPLSQLRYQYECVVINQSTLYSHFLRFYPGSFSLSQYLIQDITSHLVIMSLQTPLGRDSLSSFSCFDDLENFEARWPAVLQIYTFGLYLVFSPYHAGVMGSERKTTEVMCPLHHITSRAHAINMTSLVTLNWIAWLRKCLSSSLNPFPDRTHYTQPALRRSRSLPQEGSTYVNNWEFFWMRVVYSPSSIYLINHSFISYGLINTYFIL